MLFARVFAFSSLLATAFARPFTTNVVRADVKRDAVDPQVTSPTADTVWVTGNTYTVTWDTSDLPPLANITNTNGEVVLGSLDSSGQQHLDLDHPLANGFLITKGSIDVVCPDVPSGSYFIVLMGDSGNDGPPFKIVQAASSTHPAPSASAVSAPSKPSGSNSATSAPTAVSSLPTIPSSAAPSLLSSSSGSSILSQPLISPTVSPSANISSSSASNQANQSPSPSAPPSSGASWLHSNSYFTLAAVTLSVMLMA